MITSLTAGDVIVVKPHDPKYLNFLALVYKVDDQYAYIDIDGSFDEITIADIPSKVISVIGNNEHSQALAKEKLEF